MQLKKEINFNKKKTTKLEDRQKTVNLLNMATIFSIIV